MGGQASAKIGGTSSINRFSWIAALAVGLAANCVPARGDVSATWTSSSGANWTTAADWSTNPNYPNNGTPSGTNYQAVINTPTSVTITSNVTVDSLAISGEATIQQSNGTFSGGTVSVSNGAYQLWGGTISNTTFNLGLGGSFTLAPTFPGYAAQSLYGVNFTGNTPGTLLFSGSPLYVAGGFSFNGGTMNVTNVGSSITFDDSNPQTISNLNVTSNQYGVVQNKGAVVTLASSVTIHGAQTINQGSGGTYTMINNGQILADGTNSTYSTIIGGNFTNNGYVSAQGVDTLIFQTSSFSNTGTVNLVAGRIDAPTGGLNIGSGILEGSGTISGNLILASNSSLDSNFYGNHNPNDLVTTSGTTTLGGNLQIIFNSGASSLISPTASYEIMGSSNAILGSFSNVANGGRIETSDNSGNFQVNYGTGAYADEVVLTNFKAGLLPEPASTGLLMAGGVGLLSRRRRVL